MSKVLTPAELDSIQAVLATLDAERAKVADVPTGLLWDEIADAIRGYGARPRA